MESEGLSRRKPSEQLVTLLKQHGYSDGAIRKILKWYRIDNVENEKEKD